MRGHGLIYPLALAIPFGIVARRAGFSLSCSCTVAGLVALTQLTVLLPIFLAIGEWALWLSAARVFSAKVDTGLA